MAADALEEIEEALSARRALLRWRKPQRVRADFPLGIERLALEALPVAQVLLGQIGHCDGRYGGVAPAPAARIAAAFAACGRDCW